MDTSTQSLGSKILTGLVLIAALFVSVVMIVSGLKAAMKVVPFVLIAFALVVLVRSLAKPKS